MALTDTRFPDPEKNSSTHVDDVTSLENDFKTNGAVERADYAGAATKTNPAEIALVRKLDCRIMPSLFCMYFL